MRRSLGRVAAALALPVLGAGLLTFLPHAAGTAATSGSAARVLSGSGGVAGATVTAVAWPNGKVLWALPYKAKVPLKTVGTTTTDASGGYRLAMDLAKLGSKYKSAGGTVNIEVDVTTPTQAATWNTSIPKSRVGSHPSRVLLPHYTFDLGNATVEGPGVAAPAARLAVRPATTNGGATPASSSVNPPSPSPGPPQPCEVKSLKKLPDRKEHFLNVWAWSGAPAKVTETKGSKHTVGIAVSADGKKWGQSGTGTLEWGKDSSSSTTVTTPSMTSNRSIGNAINYRKFATWCPSGWSDWRTAPTGMDALLPAKYLKQRLAAPKFTHCVRYLKGQSYKYDNETNKTYGSGVSLDFVSLTAQANYTKQTEEVYSMKKASFICGNGKISQQASLSSATQLASSQHRLK